MRRDLTCGTSFPVTPSSGDRFYRTDLQLEYEYDGTRWLCVCLHAMAFGPGAALPEGLTAINASLFRVAHPHPGRSILVEELVGQTFVATTNDASNYWGIAMAYFVAGTRTFISSFLTQGDSPDTWTRHSGTVTSFVVPTTAEWFRGELSSKTSSPGAITLTLSFRYRLIG